MTRYVNSGKTPPPLPNDGKAYRSRPIKQVDDFDWSHYLNRNETLEWSGRPDGGYKLSWRDIAVSAFGFIFVLSGLSAIALGIWHGEPIALFIGACHFLAGFFISIGRHIFVAQKLRNTYYALTKNRALIFEKNKLHSISLHKGSHIEIQHHRNSESILFDQTVSDVWSMNNMARSRKLGFRSIIDGKEVYQKILSIIEDMK